MASKEVLEAQKFYKQVTEKSKEFQTSIPDKQLAEKIRKVGEGSEQITKHIDERTSPQKG